MSAEGDNNFIRYLYRGEEGEVIPREATHIIVHEDCAVILERTFDHRCKIVEVICHDKVIKIEEGAFRKCPSLRRVIMPGVKIIEQYAFMDCEALTDVECGKLEIIEKWAFERCKSLRNINLPFARIIERSAFERCKSLRTIDLPSARIVQGGVFYECHALMDVKFGSKLERIERGAFMNCESLERITIPLKDDLITHDNIFVGCRNLKQVDLLGGEVHSTIASFQLEDWRNDMNREIDSINQILPTADAGEYWDEWEHYNDGEKARSIRRWIRSVIRNINHYIAKHQRVLEEAATTLHFALPQDLVTNNVLPFLELPSHTFEEVDQEMEDEDNDDE